MNKDVTNNSVQAFPMTAGLWSGVPDNISCALKIVHVTDGGDVTFHYASGDVAVTAGAGMDFAIDSQCTGITSSVPVIIG